MPTLRRGRLRVAALLAVSLAAFAAWNAGRIYDKLLDLRYGAALPMPGGTAPRNAVEARVQDLDFLAGLTRVDRSFTAGAKRAFTERIAALRERAASLTDAQFFMSVAEAVALSGNAHTNVDAASWREQLDSAPVRFAWFPDGLHVIRAASGYEALLGARVLAIDGRDPRELEREAARYVAGTPEYVRAASPLVLESPQALNVMHAEASAQRLALRLREDSGNEREVEVPALTPKQAPAAAKPGRLLSPVPLDDEPPGSWHGLLDPAAMPVSLKGPGHSAYAQRLTADTLYLHLWRIRDEPGDPLAAQIGRALGDDRQPAWRRIVLDLRFDAGGDYPAAYRAIRALPSRLAPGGRLAIVVDDTTFSAAIIVGVLARHFAGERAVVVGSPVGDRLAFWAEGTPARLPNSRIEIGVSTGYHDWAHGCRELRCWWPNLYYDVRGGNLDPAVFVRWAFDDYRRGIDTVLQRVLQ